MKIRSGENCLLSSSCPSTNSDMPKCKRKMLSIGGMAMGASYEKKNVKAASL